MFQICSNWQHFYDPESGITMYMLSVGSERNITDVANLTQFSYRESSACIELPPSRYLTHNQIYYTTVWAYNGGNKQLNVSVVSDGGKSLQLSFQHSTSVINFDDSI